MLRYTVLAVLLGVAALGVPAVAAADGKAVFTEKKCTKCHSVAAIGVNKVPKGKKGPDLSGAGIKLDAPTIAKFLKKETDKESVYKAGKKVKHKSKWKGSEADLKTVAEWLASQKTKMDVTDEGGGDDEGDE